MNIYLPGCKECYQYDALTSVRHIVNLEVKICTLETLSVLVRRKLMIVQKVTVMTFLSCQNSIFTKLIR